MGYCIDKKRYWYMLRFVGVCFIFIDCCSYLYLFCFCFRGVVEILLRENVNVNVVDSRGCNLFYLVVWKGNVEICRIFFISFYF